MCHKCVEIDKKIDHFRNLSRLVSDTKTVQSIDILIAELEERKRALHPEDER